MPKIKQITIKNRYRLANLILCVVYRTDGSFIGQPVVVESHFFWIKALCNFLSRFGFYIFISSSFTS